MSRVPTSRQYDLLRVLGGGAAIVTASRRDTEPLLRRGWVDAERRDSGYAFVRITPDGLRALAAAVERYGLPPLHLDRGQA